MDGLKSGVSPEIRSDEHLTGSFSVAAAFVDQPQRYERFRLVQKLPQLPSSSIVTVCCWFKYGGGGGPSPDYFILNYTDGTFSRIVCLSYSSPNEWRLNEITPLQGKTIDSVSIEKNSDTSTISCWDDITLKSSGIFPVPEYDFGALRLLQSVSQLFLFSGCLADAYHRVAWIKNL